MNGADQEFQRGDVFLPQRLISVNTVGKILIGCSAINQDIHIDKVAQMSISEPIKKCRFIVESLAQRDRYV